MSRFTALGMIVAIMALVMAMFSFAPIASADPAGETTTSATPTTTKPAATTTTKPPVDPSDAPSAPPSSEAPSSTSTSTPTTKPSEPENTQPPAESETDEPADDESETETSESKKPETTATAPTTSEQQRSARTVAPGEVNPAIKVDITSLEVAPDKGQGQQIKVGDNVKVSGTWDARAANPQPDQTFTIEFPEELKLGGDVDFDLTGADDQGDVRTWGTCKATTGNVLTCVLSPEVAGHSDIHGDFFLLAKAVERTKAEDLGFNLNGKVERVKLPGPDGGISDGKVIDPANKSGQLQNDKRRVVWTINVPGADLADMPGGDTGSVTLTDTLSDNMKLCEGDMLDKKFKSGRPGALVDVKAPGGVTITQGDAGTPVSIVVNNDDGAFDSDKVYQIQYTTCATNTEIDDNTTVYTNSVNINGKDVAANNGQGVKQDFKPTTTPKKSGGWADGNNYRKLDWTITIPGTDAFDEDGTGKVITITDTLSANHSVCEGGVEPKVYREKRVPDLGSDDKNYDVTDQFVATATGAVGDKSFTVTLTPKDASTFADFEKYYYYVKYQTCRDGDVVPDHNTKFTNAADVNGTTVDAEVVGHEFKGDKSGRINNDRNNLKVVAGQPQPAGTTIDWFVQVDGRNLEGLDSAVITDKFSGTMAVCEVTGDLKKDLNLKVMKAGRLDTSGAGGENITASVTVTTLDPQGIEITLPKPDSGFNRDDRYFIDYTLCTSSGGLDEYGTKYSNAIDYNGQKLTKTYEQTWAGGGTGTGTTRGSFSLLKQVDSSSEKFPEGTEFTVKVEEFAPGKDLAGAPSSSYNIKVKADGTPVSGLNARGTGWTIRLSEINLPQVDGVYFEQGKFRAADNVTLSNDDTVALVTITPKSNVEVKLVNKAVLGTAKITKTVVNEEGAKLTGNEAFVFKGVIEGDARPLEFTLKDGETIDLPNLPIGAKVTFTETKLADTDLVTWSEPVFDKNPLVIGTDATANVVNVTNTAKVTQGTFQLSKKLTGPEAYNKDVPKTFDVVATWTDAAGVEQTKMLTLPSDGTPVAFGESLPGDTKVTLKETVPANGNGLAYGVPAYTGDVTIGESGVVTIGKDLREVEVVNYVEKNTGTLRVLKQVEGEAADQVGDDVEFTVEASWKDGDDYAKETLTVKNGVSTPLQAKLPVGTEVTFTEVKRGDVAGVEWGKITWGTDPDGASWLKPNGDGSVTGIVSDDPTEGRLITLTNEALFAFGSVEFTKYIVDENGENPVKATDANLPAGAEFEVKIDGIDPPLPEGTDFPAVNDTITLNAGNGFTWTSKEVLPRNTVVTFSELTPKALPGIDWARPYYLVTKDITEAEGDDRYGNTVGIIPGDMATVEIHNRLIPTTDVDIEKIVTGPKGDKVMKDPSSTFQVTATWTDVDDEARSCVLDVKPGGSVVPTAKCDAPVFDGKVQFPLGTEINFVETGAHTDVTNVQWGEVVWGVKDGKADLGKLEGNATGTTVKFTGDQNGSVVLGLENKTSSKGMIIIPLPIPLPPFGGDWGSLIPGGPGTGPGPDAPVVNPGPGPGPDTGHNGAPGKPAPSKPNQSPSLPVTGANVIWLAGAAIVLIAGGTMLTLRNRRKLASEE